MEYSLYTSVPPQQWQSKAVFEKAIKMLDITEIASCLAACKQRVLFLHWSDDIMLVAFFNTELFCTK